MFDFAECFTRSARLVIPTVAQKGLAFTFDADVPTLPVEGDVFIAERSLHRLLLGAVDLMDAGVLTISGSMDARGFPTVRLTGAGALVSGERLGSALATLGLTPTPSTRAPRLEARGTCPVAGAVLALVHEPNEGFVLDATMPFAVDQGVRPRLPTAQGAAAWVFLPNNPIPSVFKRRLERLGWDVVLFGAGRAVEDAFSRLASEQPALLVAQVLHPSSTAEALRWLRVPVASSVPRVLGLPLGHPSLSQEHPRLRLQALPFSPRDLALLTVPHERAFDLDTLSQGLGLRDVLPLLLVVDDNPVNQAVMSAKAEAMGYAVLQAENGQQALDLCTTHSPSAVLMDVDMPVMDGITATKKIRAMQRAGGVAPFPILGASADATTSNSAACLAAGMDTFIAKPLIIADVAAQLRRLSLDAPQRMAW